MPLGTKWRELGLCKTSNFLTDEEKNECFSEEEYRVANVAAAHKIFFPERGDHGSKDLAVEICKRCPVKIECLAYSLNTSPKSGIWGGVSGRDRRRIRKQKNRVRVSSTGFTEDYASYDDEYSSWWHSESDLLFREMKKQELLSLNSETRYDEPVEKKNPESLDMYDLEDTLSLDDLDEDDIPTLY